VGKIIAIIIMPYLYVESVYHEKYHIFSAIAQHVMGRTLVGFAVNKQAI